MQMRVCVHECRQAAHDILIDMQQAVTVQKDVDAWNGTLSNESFIIHHTSCLTSQELALLAAVGHLLESYLLEWLLT